MSAAVAAVCLHIAAVAAALIHASPKVHEEPQAAIALDLAPIAVAPPSPRHDIPNPDQVEAPQPRQAPKPTLQKPPFEAPKQTAATANAEVVVAKTQEQPTPPTQSTAPPAPETTRQASLDMKPDKAVAAPATGGFNSGDTKPDDLWRAQVKARIEQTKRYPHTSAAFKPEDDITTDFVVDRSGNLLSATIDTKNRFRSYPLLDAAAMDWLRRASPFPKPPPEVEGDRIPLHIILKFSVSQKP